MRNDLKNMLDAKEGYMKKILRVGIGIVLGGVLGYLYYRFVGCQSGTCPITSNPVITASYGAFMGLVLMIK